MYQPIHADGTTGLCGPGCFHCDLCRRELLDESRFCRDCSRILVDNLILVRAQPRGGAS